MEAKVKAMWSLAKEIGSLWKLEMTKNRYYCPTASRKNSPADTLTSETSETDFEHLFCTTK